jgi:hypothetical protein
LIQHIRHSIGSVDYFHYVTLVTDGFKKFENKKNDGTFDGVTSAFEWKKT